MAADNPSNMSSSPSSSALDRRYQRWRFQIFGVTWLAYASYYLVRKSFAVAKVAFDDDSAIHFTKEQMGRVDAAYLATYSLGQFIWGPLSDRFGPRPVILFGMGLAIVVGVLSGMSTALTAFILLAVVQGAAQSSGWSPLVKNMSSWFSFRERGTVMGVWCTNFAVGGFVASILAGTAIAFFSDTPWAAWRFGFFVPAATLFVVWLLIFLFQRDKPEDVGLPPIEQYHGEPQQVVEPGDRPTDEPDKSWKVIREVLQSPIVWVLAIGYFSLKMTRYTILFWGPKYVNEMLGSDASESAWISAMFEIGGPLGVLIVGYLSDRLFQSRRIPVAVISLVLLAGVLFGVNQLVLGKFGFIIFFLLTGFFLFGPDAIISGTAAMDFGTKKGAGTAAGLINGIGSIGAVFGGYIPGWISADTQSVSGQAVRRWFYSTLGVQDDWAMIFYIFMVSILATALLLLPLWWHKPPAARENGQ